jgi:hypothetical protein
MDKETTDHANTVTQHGAHQVVGDPALSKEQKKDALDVLEQDARQLSVASAEGMTGGEPTGLHEVLDAKDSLELPPTEYAYQVVLKDLQCRLDADPSGEARVAIEQALAALGALTR